MHTTEVIGDPTVSLARQTLYRFAGLSLLDPKHDSWRQLNSLRGELLPGEAAAVLRELPQATPADWSPTDRAIGHLDPNAVLARLPNSSAHLNAQFENIFGLLVSSACPPHETDYIDAKLTFQRSNTLADISGFFRAFGVMPSRRHPERADHIVQELEFMAVLIGLTRQASLDESAERDLRLAVSQDAQARFLREHLACWAPAFAKLLARQAAGGFYETAAIFLASLLTAERALFGLPATDRTPGPTSIEQPDACNGCELVQLG